MKKTIYKLSSVLIPVVLGISVALGLINFGVNGKVSKFFLEAENDYRLKFVDSSDYELSLSGTEKVILPVEVLDISEKSEAICVTTNTNEIVMCPINCLVKSRMANGDITLGLGNLSCIISGVVSGVEVGDSLQCGEVIGTVKGNKLYLQVYWGTRKLSLDELRALL